MLEETTDKKQLSHLRKISHFGALARLEKYGNPGTIEGRRKGGMNSLKVHKNNPSGFIVAKDHKAPAKSKRLSEFMGILVGDGHLANYQVSISTNSETDINHARYIAKLSQSLFGLNVSLTFRRNEKTVTIVTSSSKLVTWLNKRGMPIGNKLLNGLDIPPWIFTNKNWLSWFIRGLFDTDGCVYLDRHNIRGKEYKNLGWTITSCSGRLRIDIVNALVMLGFSPTLCNSQKSVYLRKKKDIEGYFTRIGSSNSKHLDRYHKFRVF